MRPTEDGGVALRLFTYPAGQRSLQREQLTILTALLFCVSDPMAQGVASAEEVRQCCKAAPLGLSGQQLAAARRLSLEQVQAEFNRLRPVLGAGQAAPSWGFRSHVGRLMRFTTQRIGHVHTR